MRERAEVRPRARDDAEPGRAIVGRTVDGAGFANREEVADVVEMPKEKVDYEECLACQ